MISSKGLALTSPYKVASDLKKWRDSEDLFYQILPALTKASEDDNKNHVDFEFDEVTQIDVKGLKKCHKSGYVLIEFIGVSGRHGWCHKNSKAKYFAFQFEEGFIIVPKEELLIMLKEIMPEFDNPKQRKNGHSNYKELVYKYCGRSSRKDVFTYIKKDDLLRLPHIFYPTP